MKDVPVHLTSPSGELLHVLGVGALALAAQAEATARSQGISKRRALPLTLRHFIQVAGFEIDEQPLTQAVSELEQIRRGDCPSVLSVVICPFNKTTSDGSLASADTLTPDDRRLDTMATLTEMPTGRQFFEAERDFPNGEAHSWYERLVGLDQHKHQLVLELELLLYPERLETWSRTHHDGQVLQACKHYGTRVPLILLEGDVGTGKTVLAETVGDALARRIGEDAHVHLLKINTQVRGTGQVGEMSDLIVQAFQHAERRAKQKRGEPVLLLLDEADALAASREVQQMHHEDKAGLDTLLQRLDTLRLTNLPIAALFITNRPDALDPAIRRRAALDLHFERPSDAVRRQMFRAILPELHFTELQLEKLVLLTGDQEPKNGGVPFTASDITDRLIPAALRNAYEAERALSATDLVDVAEHLGPSPKWGRDPMSSNG